LRIGLSEGGPGFARMDRVEKPRYPLGRDDQTWFASATGPPSMR
jgi:hypothetical protein